MKYGVSDIGKAVSVLRDWGAKLTDWGNDYYTISSDVPKKDYEPCKSCEIGCNSNWSAAHLFANKNIIPLNEDKAPVMDYFSKILAVLRKEDLLVAVSCF